MARFIRIYHPQDLTAGNEITLSNVASRHLMQVLRLQTGDSFRVFDGRGNEFIAACIGGNKNAMQAKLIEPFEAIAESPLAIHLGQGISRGDKMDYALQKAVELGVTTITPIYTQNSQIKYKADRLEKKLQHWRGVIIHAAQQCGRAIVPELKTPVSFNDWVEQNHHTLAFICAITKDNADALQTKDVTQVSLCIGPEGGWSASELTYALTNNFYALNLGPRILRTETAVPVAITLLQQCWGDL